MGEYEGQRLKGNKSFEIWLILDDQRRHIENPSVYEGLFGTRDMSFVTVPQAEINKFETGPVLDRTTCFIKGSGGQFYFIDDGKRRLIGNLDIFDRYKFTTQKMVDVGDLIFSIPEGPVLR